MTNEANATDFKGPTSSLDEAVGHTEASEAQTPPKPVIEIWTMQLGQWRKARARDIHVLNITAMGSGGIDAFAPDPDEVTRYKRGETSEDDYTDLYLARMKRTKILQPEKWAQLNKMERVAVACYCRRGVFCHRHLFTPLMKENLVERGYEVVLHGEIE